MKNILCAAAVCVVSFAVDAPAQDAPPPKAEPGYIVKVTEFGGGCATSVVSRSELVALEKQLQAEERLLPKAFAEAKKEWEAPQAGKSERFPINQPSPRRLSKVGEFRSKEDAQKRMDAMVASEQEKAKNSKGQTSKPWLKNVNTGRTHQKSAKSAAEIAREKDIERAYDQVKSKLTELVEAARKPAEAPAAAADQ